MTLPRTKLKTFLISLAFFVLSGGVVTALYTLQFSGSEVLKGLSSILLYLGEMLSIPFWPTIKWLFPYHYKVGSNLLGRAFCGAISNQLLFTMASAVVFFSTHRKKAAAIVLAVFVLTIFVTNYFWVCGR
jgi:hypothetical protein